MAVDVDVRRMADDRIGPSGRQTACEPFFAIGCGNCAIRAMCSTRKCRHVHTPCLSRLGTKPDE